MFAQADNALTLIAAAVAIVASVAAIVQARKKPKLDDANIAKLKTELKREDAEANARRDLHIVRLEDWAFQKVRPWGRQVVVKYDQRDALLREMASRLGIEVPEDHLPPFPEMPQLAD